MPSISIPTALVAASAIGVGGALISGSVQAGAASDAANVSAQSSAQSTQAQLQMYNQTRQDLLPYNLMGQGGLSALTNLLMPDGPIGSSLGQLSSLYGQNGPMSRLLGLSPGGMGTALSDLRQTPGYQFAFDEGMRGLDRSAASRGLLLSGGQLRDAQAFGQGLADQTYNSRLGALGNFGTGLGGVAAQYGTYGNEIAGLVNTGENAAAQTGNAGSSAAAGISNSLLGSAGQQASALQNAGTASASGIAGAANNFGSLLTNSAFQAALSPQYQSPTSILSSNPGIPFLVSDRRAKTAVTRIGTADSGLPIYTYRYKGSNVPQIGVMAQDVEKVDPSAVVTTGSGLKMVNYDKVSKLPALPTRKAA